MASLPSQNKTLRPAKGRSRRGVRRTTDPIGKRLSRIAEHPSAGWGTLILAGFVLLVGSLVAWSREQPQLVYGVTARQTRTVRVEFDALDRQATVDEKADAREVTPRVYRVIGSALDAIIGDVERLPDAVSLAPEGGVSEATARYLAEVGVTPGDIERVRAVLAAPGARTEWTLKADRLADILTRNPLLRRADWERAVLNGRSRQLELVTPSGSSFEKRVQAINIDDAAAFDEQMGRLVRSAGYTAEESGAVLSVMRARAEPTFEFDAELSELRQAAAADRVQPVVRKRAVGQTIFEKGDVLTPLQVLVYEEELREYKRRADAATLWSIRLGAIGMVGIASLASAAAMIAVCPWVIARPTRIAWVAGLVAATVVLASIGSIAEPTFISVISTAPVALLAVLLVTVYDRLTAAIAGTFAAVLVSMALTPQHAYVLINLAGIAAVVWFLPEIRDRGNLVMVALWLAAALGLATAADRLAGVPLDATRVVEILEVSVAAALGGPIVGAVMLFILPWIERAFNITTGMTLVELRDPKQPLLRELQQKAPGTYNHSLNVATIAESAAAAIDGDTLLTYAGALYHDVGKMTKPEYFVENQGGGFNKHDRLSPAMSVLVIIGHVKDGLELAREYGLPRPLHHFIEAHHGTTLVEYFYHRARQNAEDDEEEKTPEEFDFRYPGPKPRTKEAAILMLADSVESATRTLREPTPSRIESLVEQIANRRLMDGQFDECDLTLGELHKVCESISKTLASIYHGRVQYPGDKKGEKPEKAAEPAEDSPPEARDKSA